MKIFNKSFYFWHPKNEFQRNFGTIGNLGQKN